MKKQSKTWVVLGLLIALGMVPASNALAQRISPTAPPEDESTDTEQAEPAGDQQRLILPDASTPGSEDAPDTDKQKKEMYNRSMIEKLRADSAAMRVRFEETISGLRSDSRAMRRRMEDKISRLQDRIDQLEQRIEELKQSDTRTRRADTEPQERELELPGDVGTSREADTPQESSTETAPEGSIFNPNTASLSDLKSIPGLNDRLAERIEWYRREVRPFESRDDIRQVPGVDRQTFEQIAPYFHEGSY